MKYYEKNSDLCSHGVTVLSTPIIYFISGFLVFLVQLFLLGMLKRSRYLASKGDKQASNSLVLPIYYRAVIYLVILGILVGLDDMFVFYSTQVEIICIKWGLYRICSESLAIFLTNNGIGIKAFYNSILIGTTWAIISTLMPLITFLYYGWNTYLIVSSIFILTLALFYGIMWLSPQKFIHRRPALRIYARFYCVGLIIFAFAHYLLLFQSDFRVSCLIEFILAFADLLQPLLIFFAMHQDSQFWQGLFNPNDNEQVNVGNLNQPLLGVWELGRETITVVGDTIADLEQRTVPIIPFGVLQIDTSGYFSGGSARVYRGLLHQEDVAVKILFCIELTPERVVTFCQEASMLHSLAHPNIVHCHGVAVMPPAICLITEWCHHGSLYDLLHVSEYYVRDSSIGGRQSLSKRTPAHNYSHSYSRPSINMRTSNISSDIEENTNNIPDTLVQLEEVNENNINEYNPPSRNSSPKKSERDGLSGSGKSSNSLIDSHRVVGQVNRSGSRVITQKGGGYTNVTPTVNIVLDVNTHQVTEMSTLNSEKKEFQSVGMVPKMMKSLKSAASVMQSSLMGFGFGLGLTESIPLAESDTSRSASRSSLLISGDPSRNSLGYCLPASLRLKMARDCCAGVAFLHSKGLMHCDIKSLNFLVTNDFVIKLADLGESRPYKGIQKVDRIKLPKNINWSAPEILIDNGREVSELSDVWSLAVVASEILTGEIPFDTQQYRQLTVDSFVDALAMDLRPSLPPRISEDLRKQINTAWNYEVDKRCSAQTLTNVFNECLKNS